jgi:Xaa-Pro dipeptidase
MSAVRVARLRRATIESGLDAVAVMPGPNMTYLTGLSFHLSERPVLAFFVADGGQGLLVPALEETKARSAGDPWRLFLYDDTAGPRSALDEALASLGLKGRRLGIEARRIRFLELDLMARSAHSPRVQGADANFATLRMRKDASELAAMREAVAIAEAALQATLPALVAGASEKAIAAELTLQLLRAGSDPAMPFSPIVASGPMGANPHAFPTERRLEPGDLVTLDWGATAVGYASDITRTYAIGGKAVPPELQRAYDVVLAANDAGRAAARPGTTGQAVDRATRAVIEAAGLGEYFIHRTGHGLGLEGHEEPDMKEGSLIPLEPGMTFTIEPGIYLPDVGGVRIEDDVVVTPDGAESLTTLPRDLITLG